MESGPLFSSAWLHTPVPAASLQTEQTRTLHSGKYPAVINTEHKGDTKVNWFPNVVYLGSCWKMHIARLEYSSVI